MCQCLHSTRTANENHRDFTRTIRNCHGPMNKLSLSTYLRRTKKEKERSLMLPIQLVTKWMLPARLLGVWELLVGVE